MSDRQAELSLGLQFDEARHWYTYDGLPLVSVTTVLREMGIVVMSPDIPPHVLEFARQRGKAVHKAIEHHHGGTLDLATVDPRFTGYLDGYLSFLSQSGFQPAGFEKSLAHARLGFAGRPDVWGDLNGVPTVIDVKVTASVKPEVGIQLAAYRLLLTENGVPTTNRAVVQLIKDGSWKLHPMKDPGDEHEFKSALYCFQRRKKRKAA